MKRVNAFLAIILFAVTGCCRQKQSTDDLITFDVTAAYQKKELSLQDFMDVEYIPLETTNEFLCQGFLLAVGKEIILVKNRVNDGDIFVFDRTGKGLRKINRHGKGAEEYISIRGIVLDEDNNEMFVNDYDGHRFLVYDLHGNFKRSFRYTEGTRYADVFIYDRDNLICYDSSFKGMDEESGKKLSYYAIISKQDGRITQEIQIPFEKIRATFLNLGEAGNGMFYFSTPSSDFPIIPYHDHWILMESSSDTMYKYLPDNHVKPFIVRTPSIQTMDPVVFLFMSVLTDRYYFMEIVKKQEGFPRTDLMYDRQEKTISKYIVYNADYSNKRPVYMKSGPVNDKIAFEQRIEAHALLEDYEKGYLKGRLKEIATDLEEESNPVIMLIKHKK